MFTHLALQIGLVSEQDWADNPGKRIAKTVQKSAKAKTEEKSGRAAVRHGNSEIQAIRKLCQNTMHLVACVLHEFTTFFLLHLIVAVMEPLVAYYNRQNKLLRDVKTAQEWFLDQMTTGFTSHLCEIVQVLHRRADLESMGLISSSPHPVQRSLLYLH